LLKGGGNGKGKAGKRHGEQQGKGTGKCSGGKEGGAAGGQLAFGCKPRSRETIQLAKAESDTVQLATEQGRTRMFLLIFFILLVLWLLGFTLFHVTSFLIHVLLVIAVIALIMHFVRGGRRTVV
jgi:Flp pilus assembly protein TadB